MVNGYRVLVCDDHDESRALVRRIVESRDFEAVEAADGETALRELLEGNIGCAFLDIGLPDISGYEVARRVRASHLPLRPRLVAVTGHNTSKDLAMSRSVGFDLHLVKPIEIDQILAVLSTIPVSVARPT